MARYRSYKYYDFRPPDEPALPLWVQQVVGCIIFAGMLFLLALIAFTT